MATPGAAFVTLRKNGDLRGCVGHIAFAQPLWVSVREMARSAALDDNRFDPVTPIEVDKLRLEINILSPFRFISGPADVRIGEDGLYVAQGGLSGLLLPRIAMDHGWSPPQFLEQACLKAGLSPAAWRAPTCRLHAFTTEEFSDAV